MTHLQLLADTFESLISQLKDSKNRAFDEKMLIAAWNLQVTEDRDYDLGKRKTRVSLEPIYYVYVLMDPRYKGPFTFTFPGGRSYSFPYKPFYVGKGRGTRIGDHNRQAKRYPDPVSGEHKLNTIRAIHREGLEPIAKIMSQPSIEALALVKEALLIKVLGRRSRGGYLTNLAKGGEGGAGGIPGRKLSDSTRKQISASLTGRTIPPEVGAKISKALKGRQLTESQSRAISESNRRRKGVPHRTPRSDETRAKLSAALKGKSKPQSVRDAVAESNRRRAGETRQPKDPASYRKGWETRKRNAELRRKGLL